MANELVQLLLKYIYVKIALRISKKQSNAFEGGRICTLMINCFKKGL